MVTPETAFAPADLEAFKDGNFDCPGALLKGVRALIEAAQTPPEIGYRVAEGQLVGRFAFVEFAESAKAYRAGFLLARQALDILWADYLACEAAQLEEWRADVREIETLRSGVVADGCAPAPQEAPASSDADKVTPEPTHNEEGRPTPAYFSKCVAALADVSEFAALEEKGTALELVSDSRDCDVPALRRSFEFAPEALRQITLAFEELLEEEAARARQWVEALTG